MRTRRVDLERQIKEKTMGRPLNKRYFGTIANADGGTMPNGDAAFNVTVAADVGNGIAIRKLQNRTCFDFANNRYTWELQDDSTETLLVLTAI